MGYYDDKKKAQKMIMNLLSKGVKKEKIYLVIANEFGYSKTTVDRYMELIDNASE